jgi:hypothetical protein
MIVVVADLAVLGVDLQYLGAVVFKRYGATVRTNG